MWTLVRSWPAAVLAMAMTLGCQSSRHSYSADPLLLSKKPVDGKADSAGPTLVASAEPAVPPLPSLALASAKPAVPRDALPSVAAAGVPTSPPSGPASLIGAAKQPVPASPAIRSKVPGDVPASLAVRRQVPGNYGHAPDYTWLQGALDKHYQGHLELRYCDVAVDDAWGGKVVLEDDPRLNQFEDGDIVLVEGEILRDQERSRHIGWGYYPHYRVRQVWLVQRGR